MFENPGKKLMTLAKVLFWIGVAASVLWAAILLLVSVAGVQELGASGVALPAATTPAAAIISAVLTLVLGVIVSWVSSLALYAFGRVVDNSDRLAASVRPAIEAPQLRQTGK